MGSYFFAINIFFIDILFAEVKEKNKTNKNLKEKIMKNFHGMEIPMSTEMYFLSVGYEWLDEASYQMIKSDKSLEYQIRGVDVDSNGHIDLYLIRATQRGYKKPNSNTGCRLRTGSPDNG